MRQLMRWDPFAGLSPLSQNGELGFVPAFDVKETNDAFVLHADLPGINNEDLDIQITDNRLIIEGKRESSQTEKNERYYTYERSFGSFSRAFTLPSGVSADKIAAELTSGVLTVRIPKDPDAKPKQVAVKSS
jgi:HSP20 family protein